MQSLEQERGSFPPIEPFEMQRFLSKGVTFVRADEPMQVDPSTGQEVAIFNIRLKDIPNIPSQMNLAVFGGGIRIMMTDNTPPEFDASSINYQARIVGFDKYQEAMTDKPAVSFVVASNTSGGMRNLHLQEKPLFSRYNFIEVLRSQLANHIQTLSPRSLNRKYLEEYGIHTIEMASQGIRPSEMRNIGAKLSGSDVIIYHDRREKSYIMTSWPDGGIYFQIVDGTKPDRTVVYINPQGVVSKHVNEDQNRIPLNTANEQDVNLLKEVRREAFIASTILRSEISETLLPQLDDASSTRILADENILRNTLNRYTYLGKEVN